MSVRRRKPGVNPPGDRPRIISVGTATPPTCYTQEEVLDLFGEERSKVRNLYKNVHIKTRYLTLPEPGENGLIETESSKDLLQKHKSAAIELGPQAILECLSPVGMAPHDIDFLCCISSTGFLCPGISAHLSKVMGLRPNVHRIDILGMGCNAGLNGLQPVVNFAHSNPGKNGVLLCCEICSAAYVYDQSMTTAVVNSLFGDGVSAAVVRQDDRDSWHDGPLVVDFESEIVTEGIDAMRIEFTGEKFSFRLSRDIPYVIGANIEKPVMRLLGRHRLKRRHIDYWIVHGGGKKVIDAIEYNLGITEHDMRHTHAIMQNYGNVSSGAFMFSYQELCREGSVKEGDLGIVITMGPGASIETALLAW